MQDDDEEPRPATREALARALSALDAGAPYKAALEGLLLDLDEDDAEELMLLHEESRGAWLPLALSGGGEALFVGNALSGCVPPLAMLGFRVTVLDDDPARLAFERAREDAYVPGRTRRVLASSARLPFADGSFDLVVKEDGLAGADELARVCRGELFVAADNRLAYKRSLGRRGAYRVPRPLEFLAAVLLPRRGERGLGGYRRALAARFARVRSFALYPSAREFSHIVSLDAPRPRLTIGPRERRNLLKMAAYRAGLFARLTPSFGFLCSRQAGAPRLERVLAALAERVGEERPEVDLVVATRSNDCLVHTTPRDADAQETGHGRWTLHVPLSPQKEHLVRTHDRFLRALRARFPSVPVPEPLFIGELEGVTLSCERRLAGLTAPHLTGERDATARMFDDVARDFAQLVCEPPVPLSAARFEALLGARFRRVRDHAAVRSTALAIERMLDELRERLLGATLPLVLYHADLRAKHVQVDARGGVLGYLDWGASEEAFLPYVDLLHLVAHQRKQEENCSAGRTWQLVRERDGLREHERRPLEQHARELGLGDDVRAALELAYPVLVAGMAERNWDYSRPRWVHRQFGL